MSNVTINKFEMFDIVVHNPTGFVFKFFQYEDNSMCSVMDELENLYSFPINTIRLGTEQDLEIYMNNTQKKFRYLRNYL